MVKLFEGDVSRFDCRLADYEAVTLVELLVLCILGLTKGPFTPSLEIYISY